MSAASPAVRCRLVPGNSGSSDLPTMDADVVFRGQLLLLALNSRRGTSSEPMNSLARKLGKLHVCGRCCRCSCGRFRQMLAVRRGGTVGALGTSVQRRRTTLALCCHP